MTSQVKIVVLHHPVQQQNCCVKMFHGIVRRKELGEDMPDITFVKRKVSSRGQDCEDITVSPGGNDSSICK